MKFYLWKPLYDERLSPNNSGRLVLFKFRIKNIPSVSHWLIYSAANHKESAELFVFFWLVHFDPLPTTAHKLSAEELWPLEIANFQGHAVFVKSFVCPIWTLRIVCLLECAAFLSISLPPFCTATTWKFLVKRFIEEMSYVFLFALFFHHRSFS